MDVPFYSSEKPFKGIFIQHYVGVDTGDTSWWHSLSGGDVNVSSHPCAMRKSKRFGKQQMSEHQIYKKMRVVMDWCHVKILQS
jgi:hypothetical protein